MFDQKGVSKIELLVIVGIVGLLGVLAMYAVLYARSQARDAVRLSDVRQVQAALEVYFNTLNSYPETEEVLPLGHSASRCLDDGGFGSSCPDDSVTFMSIVPSMPSTGLDGEVVCGGVTNSYCYYGSSIQYFVEFELERDNILIGLVEGVNCATENGVKAGACQVNMDSL